MALLWVKWAAFLSRKVKDLSPHRIVLFGTRRITRAQWSEIEAAAGEFHAHVMFAIAQPDDEDESGYPRSANHLFVRALEWCTKQFPDKAVLWIETDCIPVKPDWFSSVQEEHRSHDKSFMGVYVEALAPHMAGCGVYPSDWKTQAPMIEKSLSAPDAPAWGPGKGQAWDTWSGGDITPKMHRSSTIQQIWRPGPFTDKNLDRIKPETALFHQCKNGSLIAALCHTKYRDFLEMQAPDSAYMMLTSRRNLEVMDTTIVFTPCARGPGGAMFCVFKPSSFMEDALLSANAGRNGVERIPVADYHRLIAQSKNIA